MNDLHAGRFELVGCIARGSVAEIYLGRPNNRPQSEGTEVAVKQLYPEHRTKEEFLQMFFDEAQLISQLIHPNIARTIEFDQSAPSPFIVTELLRGANLRALSDRLRQTGQRLPIEIGVLLASSILQGLDHVHTYGNSLGPLGIVHRNISPTSIFATYAGEVRLLDFGRAQTNTCRRHNTQMRPYKGGLAYRSPEQMEDRPLDARSDLFSLAVVVYELLLQRHPFEASTGVGMMTKVQQGTLVSPRAVIPSFPKRLSNVLVKALSKHPEQRFSHAMEMAAAIHKCFGTQMRRPSGSDLAHFMETLFADRIKNEKAARQRGDDAALVNVLRGQSLYRPPPSAPRDMRRPGSHNTEELVSISSPTCLAPPSRPPRLRTRGTPQRGETHQLDMVVFSFGLLTLFAALVYTVTYTPSTRLTIKSTPPGAYVFINGTATDRQTPTVMQVPPQPIYHLVLRREGYRSCWKQVRPPSPSANIVLECELDKTDPNQNLTGSSSKL